MPKVQQSQSFFSLRNLSRMFTNQRILLGYDRVITTEGLWVHPHDVTKEMEQLVHQNLLLLREFEDHLCDFCKQYVDGGSVKDVLLDHFEDILGKGKLIAEEYNSVLQARNHLENSNDSRRKTSGLEARFRVYGH